MIHPIVRMFDTAAKADAAVAKLAAWGFLDEDIDVVGGGAAHSHESATAAIAAAYVLRSEAKVYARGVTGGGTLVIVRAPFGTGGTAEHILDNSDPVDCGISRPERPHGWDEGAPLSSALRVPVRLAASDSFSSFWSLPILTRSKTLCSTLGVLELSDSDYSLSSSVGIPMISRKATPLSSMLGLPLLMR